MTAAPWPTSPSAKPAPTPRKLGVIAHGPTADTLGTYLIDLLHRWNHDGRANTPTVTVRHTSEPAADGDIARPNCTISVSF
jgi:hypothetical protein